MTEQKPKFTPGPWVPGRNPAMATILYGHEGKAIYPKDSNHHIAWANVFDEEGELCMNEALANAALIAAAPEMYALLKLVHDDAFETLNEAGDAIIVISPDLIERINLLLAKARGEVVEK